MDVRARDRVRRADGAGDQVTRKSPLLVPGPRVAQEIADSIRILEEHPRDPNYTVAELQALPVDALEAGMRAFCTDESGGAVAVFFDGAEWRRMTDRAVIS